jgi:hypothetical protein
MNAATNLRFDLEQRVMPRVGRILGATQDGQPIPACQHMGSPETGRALLDLSEPPYVACALCAGTRMAETPDVLSCAVCGESDRDAGWTLEPIPVHVVLGAPLLLDVEGEVILWMSREFMTFPFAATCRRDRGIVDDGDIEVHWSPR